MPTHPRGYEMNDNHANTRLDWYLDTDSGLYGSTTGVPSTWHPSGANEYYEAGVYDPDKNESGYSIDVNRNEPYWRCEDGGCEDRTSLIDEDTDLTYRTQSRAKNAAQALINRHANTPKKDWKPYTNKARQKRQESNK